MEFFSGTFKLEKVFDTFGLDIAPVERKLPDLDLSLYEEIADKLELKDFSRKQYLRYCRDAKEIYLEAIETVPAFGYINEFMFELHERWFKHDKREQSQIVYRPEVVLMVMLLAQMENKISCSDIADYWIEHNAILQYLVPGMPAPTHLISDETIRTIRCMAPESEVMKLFQEFFAEVKKSFKELLTSHSAISENVDNFRPTIGGDGQELRSSFKKGEISRKKKGAHGVSIVDCDTSTVLGCTTVDKKNHEIYGFAKILQQIHVDENCIFYSDALNTRESLTLILDEQHIDYLLPIKDGIKNTPIREQIIAKFEQDDAVLSQCFSTTCHGRKEKTCFSLISANGLSLLNKAFPNVKSVMMYQKTSQRYIKGASEQEEPSSSTTYLISTLDFSQESLAQLSHSIQVHWAYEAHHNTLDVVMLQDYRALSNSKHLAYTVGFNKIIYNVMNFTRYRMSEDGYDRTKYRSAKTKANARPISFNRAFNFLQGKPLIAMKYLMEYFLADDSDKLLKKSI